MEIFRRLFIEHSATWVLGLFFGAMTYLVNKLVNSLIETQKKKRDAIAVESKEQEQIKNGLLALLRFRVNRIAKGIKLKGYMTEDERFDLIDIFSAYEALGGNGKTKIIYDYVMDKYDVGCPLGDKPV